MSPGCLHSVFWEADVQECSIDEALPVPFGGFLVKQ